MHCCGGVTVLFPPGLSLSCAGVKLDESTDIALSTLFIGLTIAMLAGFVVIFVRNMRKIMANVNWQEVRCCACLCECEPSNH
jgi:hypothetical protein